jgi:hypothetical protein
MATLCDNEWTGQFPHPVRPTVLLNVSGQFPAFVCCWTGILPMGSVAASLTGREVAFIHVPKTGGTYVGQFETDHVPVIRPITYLGHVTVLDSNASFELDVAKPFQREVVVPSDRLKKAIVFSNVRNIFRFLVSYLHHAGGFNPRYRDPLHYDFNAANRGFDYLVRAIADREEPWPSRRFIHYSLFAQPSGKFLPHWINYTEFLDDDLGLMASRYRLRVEQRPKQRVSSPLDHRPFYNDRLIDLVLSTWSREIQLFGFDFDVTDSRHNRRAILQPLTKPSYVWRHDKFTPGSLRNTVSNLLPNSLLH